MFPVFISSYPIKAKDRDTDEKNRKTNFRVSRVDFIGSEGNSTETFLTADSPSQEDAEGIFITHIRWEINIWNLFVIPYCMWCDATSFQHQIICLSTLKEVKTESENRNCHMCDSQNVDVRG